MNIHRIAPCVLLLASGLVGCNRQAEISHYQVAREAPATGPAAETAAGERVPQRMLAVILPNDPQVWFFKAMGRVEDMEALAAEFQQLLGSVDLDSAGQPTWTLPNGWTEQPGNQFRYATLVAPSGVELTVSSLPAPGGKTSSAYVLDNINRWRNQLQLAPVQDLDSDSAAQTVDVAGRTAYQVDLVGSAAASSGSAGPMTGGLPPNDAVHANLPRTSSPATTSPSTNRGLTYEKPAGWEEGRTSSMRLASFVAERDGKTAEITVIALGPAAGSMLDNVNRWRGQVNLPPIDQAELDATLKSLAVDGTDAQYIQIHDPDAGSNQAIFAVTVPRPGQTVFVKMMGPNEIVLAEAEAFEQFVRSLRFVPEQ